MGNLYKQRGAFDMHKGLSQRAWQFMRLEVRHCFIAQHILCLQALRNLCPILHLPFVIRNAERAVFTPSERLVSVKIFYPNVSFFLPCGCQVYQSSSLSCL